MTLSMNIAQQDSSMANLAQSNDVHVITFQNGLPGFPNYRSYKLVDLDDGAYPPLKLLISMDNPGISFILYPHKNESSLYDNQTTSSITGQFSSPRSLDIFSIVTIRMDGETLELTTNLQAPILIDNTNLSGRQQIQTHLSLNAQHPIQRYSPSF